MFAITPIVACDNLLYFRALKWIRCFIEIEFLDEFYIITLPLYSTLCIDKISMTILFLLARVTKNCAFSPFYLEKKILASKTVTRKPVAPSFTKRNKIYIHHHCIIYKENFFIEFRYNPPLEKNYTAKQNPSNTFPPSKSAKTLSSFFLSSPSSFSKVHVSRI